MKKTFSVVLVFGLVWASVSATQILKADNYFKWEFTPEASTRVGFDLDTRLYGIKGAVEIDLAGTLYGKQSPEFVGDNGLIVGSIKVDDLKIVVDISNQTDDYNSKSDTYQSTTQMGNSGLMYVNWGDITAKVNIGPAYIKLVNQNNAQIRTYEGVASSPFSVVQYNIILPTDTVSRKYQARGIYGNYNLSEIDNNNINTDGLNAIGVGFSIPKILSLELGFETAYAYDESSIVKTENGLITTATNGTKTVSGTGNQSYKYNPFALSISAEITPMEALSIKLKASAINGLEPSSDHEIKYEALDNFGEIGNPITAGLFAGYKLPLGEKNLTISLGGEIEYVKQQKIGEYQVQQVLPQYGRAVSDYKTSLDTFGYEAGLGIRYDWAAFGVSEDEDDHLGYESADKKVTDGISLSLFYGSIPNPVYADQTLPYVGAQFAMWDSEDGDKKGILPVQLSVVGNLNYAFAREYDAMSYLSKEAAFQDTFTVSSAGRLDAGIGVEVKYPILAKITPYLGVLYKRLDLFAEDDVVTVDGEKRPNYTAEDKYDNGNTPQTDLRVKIGTDVALSKNVTLDAQWLSGALLRESANFSRVFSSADYFTNNSQTMVLSSAKAGLLSVGLKVGF